MRVNRSSLRAKVQMVRGGDNLAAALLAKLASSSTRRARFR